MISGPIQLRFSSLRSRAQHAITFANAVSVRISKRPERTTRSSDRETRNRSSSGTTARGSHVNHSMRPVSGSHIGKAPRR